MTKKIIITLMGLYGIGFAAAVNARACILPVPDGDEPNPSPPSLHGKIVHVAAGLISVTSDSSRAKKNHPIKIRINGNTALFTFFGGTVDRNQLMVGSTTAVWFVHCKPAHAGTPPLAAVLQVDSRREMQ